MKKSKKKKSPVKKKNSVKKKSSAKKKSLAKKKNSAKKKSPAKKKNLAKKKRPAKKKNSAKKKSTVKKIKQNKRKSIKTQKIKKENFILKVINFQNSLKPEIKLKINFSLEKYIQAFFDKISNTISEYKT